MRRIRHSRVTTRSASWFSTSPSGSRLSKTARRNASNSRAILPGQQHVTSGQPVLHRIQMAARFSGVRPWAGATESVALISADLSMAGHDRGLFFG